MRQTHTPTDSLENSDDLCQVCKGTGIEFYHDESGNCFGRECKCGVRQKEIMNGRIRFADIPASFKDIRIKDFDVNAYENEDNQSKAAVVMRCVGYWLENFADLKNRGMGLYMYSKTKGSGKTRMAVSIANELIHVKKCQVKFCTSLQILNEIKASWDRNSDCSESNLLNFLSSSEILVIDDFGTEQSDKPWINERFYQIINSRYIDNKVTIFTSNERIDLLKYDDRITNRIKERTFQIPFPEESVRDSLSKKHMRELINAIK